MWRRPSRRCGDGVWCSRTTTFPGTRTVNGIADLGYERATWFKDSEGNILAVATATP
jgi:hypothetical protein